MPKSMRDRLLEKGWNEEEVERTMDIMYSDKKIEKHAVFSEQINPVIFWTALLVAILANFIISIVLIPFLMMLEPFQLYIMLIPVALMFGLIFNLLLREIENVDKKHQVIAGAFIPMLALINIFIIVNLANSFSRAIQTTIQSPFIVSTIYIVSFSLPHLIYKAHDVNKNKQKKPEAPIPSV